MKHLIWKHTADYSSLLFTAFVCILYFSQVRPHHLTFLTDLHSGSCGGSSQLDGLCFVGVSVKPLMFMCKDPQDKTLGGGHVRKTPSTSL